MDAPEDAAVTNGTYRVTYTDPMYLSLQSFFVGGSSGVSSVLGGAFTLDQLTLQRAEQAEKLVEENANLRRALGVTTLENHVGPNRTPVDLDVLATDDETQGDQEEKG